MFPALFSLIEGLPQPFSAVGAWGFALPVGVPYAVGEVHDAGWVWAVGEAEDVAELVDSLLPQPTPKEFAVSFAVVGGSKPVK